MPKKPFYITTTLPYVNAEPHVGHAMEFIRADVVARFKKLQGFDVFFNISGSLFVEISSDAKIRSSAQGLFMMMTNGFGAVLGSFVSGYLIQHYFVLENKMWDWHGIWLCFAAYSLVVAVLFALLFKHKHDPKQLENVSH